MFAKMTGRRLPAESDGAVPLDTILRRGVRDKPDVAALASLDKDRVCVLAWHYHDDDVPGADADVEVSVTGLPAAARRARVQEFRIDETHSNAFTAWKRLSSPTQPTPEQYAQLEPAGRLAALDTPAAVQVDAGKAVLRLRLPRQAVSLLVLDWARSAE